MNLGVGEFLSPELIQMLAAGGGLFLTAVFGFLLVRKARAARRRQIEGFDEPAEQPSSRRPRRALTAEDLEEDEGATEAEEAQGVDQAGEEAPSDLETETTAPMSAEPGARAKAVEPSVEPVERRKPRADVPSGAGRVLEFPPPAPVPSSPVVPAARSEDKKEKREQRKEQGQDQRKAETDRREPPVVVSPAPPVAEAPKPKRKGAEILAPGLARTRSGWISRLGELFAGKREIDAGLLDEIEKVLLTADIGVRTAGKLLEEMRSSLSRKELSDPESAWAYLQKRTQELLSVGAKPVDWSAAPPMVLLVIGVNGSGKTTTIGKLAARLIGDGKKVLVGAGDTFRAAAAEQLEIWAGRVGATLVRGKEGADPSSVLFDAVKRGAAEGFDVVICDTAGRLHTKTDLMEELQKVRRVIAKAAPGAPHETWLVIDSTSGQNAIAQAQIFTQAMAVSGIVLTKLDGTAKGGVILGISDQLQIPVRFIGIGERVEDLREFDAEEFVEALYQRDAPDADSSVTSAR